jgi:ADP-ribose pyrophosphatase YjhB (NUDIX family)
VATPRYILDLRRSYGQGRLLLVGVSGVVVRDDLEPPRSHILLVRRSDTGRWSLPAGIVEPDEQPAATIVRELFEETRVRGRADRLALLTTDPELVYPNGDRCQYISITFRCSYLGGDAQVGDEECTEVAWFPTDQLPGELPALLRRRIATALADQDACVFDT